MRRDGKSAWARSTGCGLELTVLRKTRPVRFLPAGASGNGWGQGRRESLEAFSLCKHLRCCLRKCSTGWTGVLPYLNHRTRAPGNSYRVRKPCSLHSMKKKASHSVNYKIFICTYICVYSGVGSNIGSSFYQNFFLRASLAVQWLRLHASTAGGTGLIPGWGTMIPHAAWCGKNKK